MAQYKVGKIVKGNITGIEKYGIFVNLDNFYSGLIHISEISDNFVRDINKFVNIGETIKVKVLDTDDETFHVKLSIKNLDYRLNKKRETYIQETEHGFNTLKKELPIWIEDKKSKKN